jgi:hypothetical protein
VTLKIESNLPNSDHRGFTADLALSLVVPWLILWRVQLSIVSSPVGFWSGWLAFAVVAGFIVLAIVLGSIAKTARGYLPFAARWLLLAASLVLLIWALVDVASGPATPESVAQVNAKAREDAEAAFTMAKTPEDKRVAEQAIAAADGLEAFGEILEAGAKQGVTIPAAPREGDASVPAGADAAAILREYGPDLAAGKLPRQLEPVAEELGLNAEDLLLQAGMALATQAIAEYFGMPYVVAFKILVALLDDGELSPGEIIRLGTAVALSVDADGLDMDMLAQQFDDVGQYAATMNAVMAQAEAMGVDEHIDPAIWQIGRELAQEVAGSGSGDRCDAAAIGAVLTLEPDNEDEQVRLLSVGANDACRDLSDPKLRELIRKYDR